MDVESVKNDIKTIFLIVNTFSALGGLFPLSLCVSILLTKGFISPAVDTLGFGAPVVGLAALGYYAAFNENKKTLYTYCTLMVVVAALEVAAVVADSMPAVPVGLDMPTIVYFSVHIGIMMAAVSLAVALAKRVQIHIPSDLQKSKQHPFLKYLGYGAGLVFIFIIFKFFSGV